MEKSISQIKKEYEESCQRDYIVQCIQNSSLLEDFFFFINKGLIREILDKLEEGFYPDDISMNDEGNVTIDSKIIEESDLTKEQLEWYLDTAHNFIGGCQAPFALVGCINRIKKQIDTKKGDKNGMDRPRKDRKREGM